jgi:hypothetical protein
MMTRRVLHLAPAVAVLLSSTVPLTACTVFTAAQDGVVLFAGNEDWKDPYNRIRFFPPEPGKFGRVYIGCARYGSGEMGMNDQGLVFDALSVPKRPVRAKHDKPEFAGNLVEKVMEECDSVADVIEVFTRYDRSRYDHSQLMFADQSGDAVLIDANNVYRKRGGYLLATNFRLSDGKADSYPCQRFQIADRALRERSMVSIDLFRKILANVHMEGPTPTQYSAIFDLKQRRIHLYHFHNYENVVTIDVRAELAKGWHAIDLASLFAPTFAAATYVSPTREPVTGALLETIAEKGVEDAIQKYEFISDFEADRYDVGTSPMNVVGLELMWSGKVNEAIQWLRFATKTFPKEPDGHLCLGGAYLAAGDRDSARKCFERAGTLGMEFVAKARLATLGTASD